MNQRPSSFNQDNDEINLAISYQGFSISVVGPASKALDFVNKLIPDYQVNQLPVARGLQSSSSPASVPTTLVHSEPCQPGFLLQASQSQRKSGANMELRTARQGTVGILAIALRGHFVHRPCQQVLCGLARPWNL